MLVNYTETKSFKLSDEQVNHVTTHRLYDLLHKRLRDHVMETQSLKPGDFSVFVIENTKPLFEHQLKNVGKMMVSTSYSYHRDEWYDYKPFDLPPEAKAVFDIINSLKEL